MLYIVVGNREWNCGAHFAEEGMPFSESAVQRIAFPTKLDKYVCYVMLIGMSILIYTFGPN